MNKKNIKDLIILAAVIIFAAIGARVLAGGETLSDYAAKTGQSIESGSATSSDSSDQGKELSTEATSTEAPEISTTETSSSDTSADTASSAESTELSSKPDTDVTSTSSISPDRVTYMEGFYYEPISDEVFHRISGISYPVDCTVSLDDLRYVGVMYVDFDGKSQNGELICNKSIAQDLVEIFYELFKSDYAIESIKLVDEYNGDDTASMLANNTSCFNYRVVEGTTRLSNHAYGLAIDLNPFYNPYITYNKDLTVNISPEGAEAYADRDADFPYKIDESDLACILFKEHGFKWGGNWNNSKDYQHFEKK